MIMGQAFNMLVSDLFAANWLWPFMHGTRQGSIVVFMFYKILDQWELAFLWRVDSNLILLADTNCSGR